MAIATSALDSARVYLNDTGKQIWTDAILLPFLKEAHRDMLLVLLLNGISVLREKSATINVAAVTGLTLTLPADLLEPIWLKERAQSSSNPDDWTPMTEVDFEPDINQDVNLNYWCWREEEIKLVGATTARSVLLRYWKTLTPPAAAGDTLGFINAEIFLGPQTAGYAAGSVGNTTLAQELLWIQNSNIGTAGARLDMLIRANVKGQQNLPARRIPYRRFQRSGFIF